ncbi:hypothetical protein MLD38_017008 [Melastoma candidum]|uniref:Uncharacterized protein n=1 Tax=Melastoma candidum TaxID=119954 RepID=A0ACB9QXH5_9MYRT|nr:hypothetical protein MLD38_017008 [Melastoma candidum]
MRVLFLAGDGEKRHVRYGLIEGELDETAEAKVERYEREDICDYFANGTIGGRDPRVDPRCGHDQLEERCPVSLSGDLMK